MWFIGILLFVALIYGIVAMSRSARKNGLEIEKLEREARKGRNFD
jgi:hypothetical protein